MNQRPHLEWQLSLQGLIEELTPQEIRLRDDLVTFLGFPREIATHLVEGRITPGVALSKVLQDKNLGRELVVAFLEAFPGKLFNQDVTSFEKPWTFDQNVVAGALINKKILDPYSTKDVVEGLETVGEARCFYNMVSRACSS